MTSTKRQISFFELLQEAEYAKSAEKETGNDQNSAFRGELAVLLSAARAQSEWEVLAGVPGDGADLGRFFRVAVPRASEAALAYGEAKGVSVRRRAAEAVFATKVCWVLPNVSGMDLLQPWPTAANANVKEAQNENSEEGFESDFEEDPADFEAQLAELSTEAARFIRSDPPPPSQDPNFALFPVLLKDCEGRSPNVRPVDMNVVKDSDCTLAEIGREMLDSAEYEDGSEKLDYSLHDIGTCCLRASEGPAPKTSGDAAVVPSHRLEGPPRWADEPVGALAGRWDVSPDVRGLWPTKEELKLEAGAMEAAEWHLRPEVLRPKRRRRKSWDADFVGLGWHVLPASGALEPSADGAMEGPPRLPLERLWRNAKRRRVGWDFLMASLRAEQALATASSELPSAGLTAILHTIAATEVAVGNNKNDASSHNVPVASFSLVNADKNVSSEPGNGLADEGFESDFEEEDPMEVAVSDPKNNVSSCNVPVKSLSFTNVGKNEANDPGNGPIKVGNSGPIEKSRSTAAPRMIPASVSHTIIRKSKSSKAARSSQQTKDSVKSIIASWKKTNPGRPAYEVLAAHRRIPRWRDYDSRGLAAWLDRCRRNLREAAGALELSTSLPRFQFTPRTRKASFVDKLRANVSLAGPLTAVSRSEQLAEAMSTASTCVFRSSASLAVDSSVGGRWSFKVLGGSVSPPKITGYGTSAVRPASAQSFFGPECGFWHWDGHKKKNPLKCPSEELAERFAASDHCIYLSFPEGWVTALSQEVDGDPSIELEQEQAQPDFQEEPPKSHRPISAIRVDMYVDLVPSSVAEKKEEQPMPQHLISSISIGLPSLPVSSSSVEKKDLFGQPENICLGPVGSGRAQDSQSVEDPLLLEEEREQPMLREPVSAVSVGLCNGDFTSTSVEKDAEGQLKSQDDDNKLQGNQDPSVEELERALPPSPLSEASLHEDSVWDEPNAMTSLLVDSVVAQAEAADGSVAQVDRVTMVTEYSFSIRVGSPLE